MSLQDTRIKQKNAIALPDSAQTLLDADTLGFSVKDRALRLQILGVGGSDVVNLEASLDGTNWEQIGTTTGPGLLDVGDFDKPQYPYLRLDHTGSTAGTFNAIAKAFHLSRKRR